MRQWGRDSGLILALALPEADRQFPKCRDDCDSVPESTHPHIKGLIQCFLDHNAETAAFFDASA